MVQRCPRAAARYGPPQTPGAACHFVRGGVSVAAVVRGGGTAVAFVGEQRRAEGKRRALRWQRGRHSSRQHRRVPYEYNCCRPPLHRSFPRLRSESFLFHRDHRSANRVLRRHWSRPAHKRARTTRANQHGAAGRHPPTAPSRDQELYRHAPTTSRTRFFSAHLSTRRRQPPDPQGTGSPACCSPRRAPAIRSPPSSSTTALGPSSRWTLQSAARVSASFCSGEASSVFLPTFGLASLTRGLRRRLPGAFTPC